MSGAGAAVTLGAWLEAKIPPVPPAFRARLLADAEAGAPAPGSPPFSRVRSALKGALAREGERKGAFRLLAADAWITYACEAALAADDAEAELRSVLDEVLAAGAP